MNKIKIKAKTGTLVTLLAFLPLLAWAFDYDLNGDGEVNQADYDLLAGRVVDQDAAYGARYDVNGDGAIDVVDLEYFRSHFADCGGTFTVNGVSFTMVAVEGGTFTMGATAEQGSDAHENGKPVHQVTLSNYCIGQTEVTQELWQAVIGSNPSYFTGDLQRPVEKVSWNDCQTFITKLNQMTGMTFRLPTEAEWEYAARGGNRSQGYKYAGSNTLGDVAWYQDNSGSTTHPVATKAPNELGLYDMSGNVSEWCQDWWYLLYDSAPASDPTGPGTGSERVNRGGCWRNDAGYCRVSYRSHLTPSNWSSGLGLRLAL